jgi:hypothetical protein
VTVSVLFSSVTANLLAIGWEPELRGILTVIIGFVALCGSTYLLLGTNLGSRLGFLVALAALFGWMAVMAAVWWVYGIGLQGQLPTWEPDAPISIVRDSTLMNQTSALETPVPMPPSGDFTELSELTSAALLSEGWIRLPDADPGRGQAVAAAEEILVVEAGEFNTGEFVPIAVYDRGGERYPKIGNTIDFLAFFHTEHHALVEVAPVVPQRLEPGRAPARPIIDESQPRRYVLMVRDLGTHRQPAAFITIGSTMMFLLLCWMLHRRERLLIANRALEPAKE